MVDEILKILDEGDSYAAAQRIQREGSADEIGKRYAELSHQLYWKKKNVSYAIAVGRFGIAYCLTQSTEQLAGVAKGIAFNVASFAWVGWGEEGVTISAEDVEAGRDAAKLNLRLAVELHRGDKPMMNAHWMIGAYCLADGRIGDAVAAFDEARGFAERAADVAAGEMCRGYAALARLVENRSLVGEFEEPLGTLAKIGSEDSAFYIEQLRTARRVFLRE